MTSVNAPRVLIITLKRWWIGVARLPMGLREAGFEVAAWCPEESFVARSGGLARHYPWAARADWQGELLRIVAEWRPEVIIPADETIAAFLRQLARRPVWFNAARRDLRTILVRSLGDVRRTRALDGKIQLQRLARTLGIRTPDDRAAPDVASAVGIAQALGYPVVLKDEYAAGGLGVRICADEAALRTAWAALVAAKPRPSLRQWVRERLKQPFRGGGARRSVQRFIQGRPAFHAVVAWQGRQLGGFTAVVEVAHPPVTGPSCVVRVTELPEISEACIKLIDATGLTGFAGFDFMIEAGTGRAYILECNPRPTPVSHLGGLVGADLAGLFLDALQGRPMAAATPSPEQMLALFPQELLRDAHSRYLGQAHLDFPKNDSALVAAFLERYPELAPAMAAARCHLPPG